MSRSPCASPAPHAFCSARLSPLASLLVFCLALLSAATADSTDGLFPPQITSESGAALYPRGTSATNSTLYFSFSSAAELPVTAQLSVTLGGAVHTPTSAPLCSINGAPVASSSLSSSTGVLTVTPAAPIPADSSSALVCTGMAITNSDTAASARGQAVAVAADGTVLASGAGIGLSGAYSNSALASHVRVRVMQGKNVAEGGKVTPSPAESNTGGENATDTDGDDDDDDDDDSGSDDDGAGGSPPSGGMVIGALGSLEISLAGSFPLALPTGSLMRLDFPSADWDLSSVEGCNVVSDGGQMRSAGVTVTEGDSGDARSLEINLPVASSTSSSPGAATTVTCNSIRTPPTATAASELPITLFHPSFTVGAGALPETSVATVRVALPPGTIPKSDAQGVQENLVEQVLTVVGRTLLLTQNQLDQLLGAYTSALSKENISLENPFALVQRITATGVEVVVRSTPQPVGGLLDLLLLTIGNLLTGLTTTLQNTLGAVLGGPVTLGSVQKVTHLVTCLDGTKNELETDVDCGGSSCQGCAQGKTCSVAGDCLSKNCLQSKCAAPGATAPPEGGGDGDGGNGGNNAAGTAGVGWATVALLATAAAAVSVVAGTGAGAGANGLVEITEFKNKDEEEEACVQPKKQQKKILKSKSKTVRRRSN